MKKKYLGSLTLGVLVLSSTQKRGVPASAAIFVRPCERDLDRLLLPHKRLSTIRVTRFPRCGFNVALPRATFRHCFASLIFRPVAAAAAAAPPPHDPFVPQQIERKYCGRMRLDYDLIERVSRQSAGRPAGLLFLARGVGQGAWRRPLCQMVSCLFWFDVALKARRSIVTK